MASKRAAAALAAILSISTLSGGVYYAMQPDGVVVPAAVKLASDTLIQPWEGRSLRAYRDIVGVWTICDGDTANVRPGMVETPAGCNARLTLRLNREFYPALKRCIPHFETKPVSWQSMMLSLSYNVGTGAGCNSTAARLGKSGQYQASCTAATAFNKAGGRMVIGLKHRREFGDAARIGEQELCQAGLQ